LIGAFLFIAILELNLIQELGIEVHAVWSYKKHSIRNTSWIFQKIKKQLLAKNLGLRNTDILAKIIFVFFWEKSVLND